ncbi:MAG: AraC family transcriptional regulator [Pseudomonadota bacterium]
MTSPLTLPISFMTALIALAMLLVVVFSRTGNPASRTCFALLFGTFLVQAVMVGARFDYGLEALAPYQRVLPFAIGPLAYLGFRTMGEPGAAGRTAPLHAGTALLAIAVCWLWPLAFNLIDVLISLSFATYIGLMLGLYRRGPDGFEATSFGAIPNVRAWLLATVLFLSGVLALDIGIAVDFTAFEGRHAAALITLGNGIVIPFLLAAAILYPRRAERADEPATNTAKPIDESADRALLEQIDALLAQRRLYRDPDLSLSRLARRLGVPVRRVSEAINHERGLNVSQFVNRHRIAEAADLLVTTDRPVAEIMVEVGLPTKSNFFRAFREVHGCSPSDHRKRHQRAGSTAKQV